MPCSSKGCCPLRMRSKIAPGGSYRRDNAGTACSAYKVSALLSYRCGSGLA
jgi:hypothetical protein